MSINLDTSDFENHFILHPRFSNLIDELKHKISLMEISEHFFLFSSGTTAAHLKGYALSKNALLTNARAVNEHLNLKKDDIWGLTLPYYHVGGLSVFFRANLLNHEPVNLFPWEPHKIINKIIEKNVSVISLVPTQVYDLVSLELKCPANLKYVLVGGDYLSADLYNKAVLLGWPLIKTFGMTEIGSQLATSSINDPRLKILPIHQVKLSNQNQILIKSETLFTLLFTKKVNWKFTFSKNMLDAENYFPLPDTARIEDNFLIPLGRIDHAFKSSGHLLDLGMIKEELQTFVIQKKCWGKIEVFVENDQRKGKILCLIYEKEISLHLLEDFEKKIYPVRVEKKISVSRIDRTDLGKFKYLNNR